MLGTQSHKAKSEGEKKERTIAKTAFTRASGLPQVQQKGKTEKCTGLILVSCRCGIFQSDPKKRRERKVVFLFFSTQPLHPLLAITAEYLSRLKT